MTNIKAQDLTNNPCKNFSIEDIKKFKKSKVEDVIKKLADH